MWRRVAVAFVFSVVAASAWAQYDPRPHWVVAAGGSLTIYKIVAINPDCSSLGQAAIHLLSAPAGGQVTLGARRDYLAFAPGNPRSACNHRKLPATEMIYHASPGFAGIDRFSAEVIDATGVARTRHFEVEVR